MLRDKTRSPMPSCCPSTRRARSRPWSARPDRSLGPGHPAAQTHDNIHYGTTTLFAALDVLDGTVLSRGPAAASLR